MKYTDCQLYKLQSKRYLCYLLKIRNKDFLKQAYISTQIDPYIDTKGKPRLIEPPSKELKAIQKRIKTYLGAIEIPDNVFSGIKGRSFVDNANYHIGNKPRYLYKIDLSSFFPTISRETVYRFFLDDLQCSPDIANILTNLTTIDLTKTNPKDLATINTYLSEKDIKCLNHLISGAPTSQILSYLVNHKMFDEIQELSNHNNITMTIYVDDITFSSEKKITAEFRNKVTEIINKYGYQLSTNKVRYYTKSYPKLVTGVIIDSNGRATIKNSLRKNIINEHENLLNNPNDDNSKKRLRGLLTAARQVDKNAFNSIRQFAFKTNNINNKDKKHCL